MGPQVYKTDKNGFAHVRWEWNGVRGRESCVIALPCKSHYIWDGLWVLCNLKTIEGTFKEL